jgi:hypothetical protein
MAALTTGLSSTAANANDDFDGTNQNPAATLESPDDSRPAPEPGVVANSCGIEYAYTVSNAKPILLDIKKVYGDSGFNLSIAISAGATVSASVNGSITVEASAIVASAKATYGLTYGVSFTATATFTGQCRVGGGDFTRRPPQIRT